VKNGGSLVSVDKKSCVELPLTDRREEKGRENIHVYYSMKNFFLTKPDILFLFPRK
jgi:hypothetical protein